MFDRLAADGDRTSTGGEVIGRSSMYDERGKMYARKGSKATCGTCKGAWEIYGTAGNWMDDGFPMVKDGDRVLCPCGKNVVFAYGGSNAFYSESREKATTSSKPAQFPSPVYDEQVEAQTRHTALHGYPYLIEKADGQTLCGRVDGSGRLPRIHTESATEYTIHWGDDALAHEGWH
ncbi:PAAR domain-containing protein [Burkholderia sp. Ac-20365]|uniref:PAAR domain-containing protein n=1 Tax=Burkholderia sp. Ac-20365 TaxID=2703897 RepID=UPI00197C2894|nr:PAAR domain-containing protein [Burkholderia sp. Ac-20365]MBN3764391.1 PAAR domain-containing protein [Burkholderia sp. Ac-20365]